ncbi:hypothetical protein JW835_08870 [bacterium]|nr:hypothetical protein [bacterium]
MTKSHNRMIQCRYVPLILICGIFAGSALTALDAQESAPQVQLSRIFRLSGQAYLYGEVYGAHGIEGRRPPSTGRIGLRPVLQISNMFNVSADLLLSTEGSRARQNMNILGLHPAWSWGKAHLGDYTDQFSRYTLNGVNIKGAEIDLYPGQLRFTLGGGQTKRAVNGNVINQSYAQYLFGSRLGYGKQNSSYIDLIVLKVKDDIGSLSVAEDFDYDYVIPDTLESEMDTIWIEPPYHPLAVTPQENLVAGIATRLSLFDRKLTLEWESTASGYTKDLNAEPIDRDSLETSEWLKTLSKNMFTPRTGSSLDYATDVRLGFQTTMINTQIGYKIIGPGFRSLGLPSMINDRKELNMNTSLRLGDHRLNTRYCRLSDNLLKQKQETNTRHQIQSSLNSKLGNWHSNVSINLLLMGNNASKDSLSWDFSNWVLSTHQSLAFKDAFIRQVGVQYTFQHSDKNIRQQETKAYYHTANLTSMLRLMTRLTMNLSLGLSYRNSDQKDAYTTQVYSFRLTHIAFRNRLSTSLFSTSSMVRDTRSIRTGINSSYRLTEKNQLNFKWFMTIIRSTRNFEEQHLSLMMTHQL